VFVDTTAKARVAFSILPHSNFNHDSTINLFWFPETLITLKLKFNLEHKKRTQFQGL